MSRRVSLSLSCVVFVNSFQIQGVLIEVYKFLNNSKLITDKYLNDCCAGEFCCSSIGVVYRLPAYKQQQDKQK